MKPFIHIVLVYRCAMRMVCPPEQLRRQDLLRAFVPKALLWSNAITHQHSFPPSENSLIHPIFLIPFASTFQVLPPSVQRFRPEKRTHTRPGESTLKQRKLHIPLGVFADVFQQFVEFFSRFVDFYVQRVVIHEHTQGSFSLVNLCE